MSDISWTNDLVSAISNGNFEPIEFFLELIKPELNVENIDIEESDTETKMEYLEICKRLLYEIEIIHSDELWKEYMDCECKSCNCEKCEDCCCDCICNCRKNMEKYETMIYDLHLHIDTECKCVEGMLGLPVYYE